jgi:ubiquinone/menaquinone biosynthesis C-methylase UbiE
MHSSHTFSETADIETSSEDYARRFAGRIGAWFLKIQEDATLSMLHPHSFRTALDVGGGHGQLTGPLIRKGYQLTVLGSDDACKARIQSLIDQDYCKFKVGNILDLPFPDQSFDVVLSFRLLPHVSRWKQFLHELTRVARKSIILDYPEARSVNILASQMFWFKKQIEGNTRTYSCFSEAELLEVFKTRGFIRAERYPEFFLPMVLHRKLNNAVFSSFLESVCRKAGLTSRFGSPVIMKLVRNGGVN